MDVSDHLGQDRRNDSVSPADDFYMHVNGIWLDENPIPAEYPGWGAALEVHVRNEEILHRLLKEAAAEDAEPGTPTQMVGDYFTAGMNTDRIAELGITPIGDHLDAIDAIEDLEGLKEVLVQLKRIGVGALHSLGVAPDFDDSTRYLVHLGQGGLGLPERDYYIRDDDASKGLLASYQVHVANQLANLGLEDSEEAASSIVDLEQQLAQASHPAEVMRDPDITANRHQVYELDTLMPEFGLSRYTRSLGVNVDNVNVNNPGFFEALQGVVAATPIEDLKMYLRWHLVRRYAPSLSPEFEDEAFDFYNRTLSGQQEPRERWTKVLSAASSDIGEQVAKLYVDEAFSEQAKDRCEEMVEGLLAAMERSIRDLDWMTEATKEAALLKLSSFGYKIGYPDEWRQYEGLEIRPDSYAANRMASAAYDYDRQFGRLDEKVDNTEWAMPAHVVNAYYHPMLNEIVFPAGILQPPFFYEDADDAVIYGGIGTVIGHEITHGFDDKGSKYDENGRLRNWWSDEDREEFDRRAQVLVDQFNEYQVETGQHLNGKLTLGENIADLGGLAIAYDAFVDTLDGDDVELGGFSPRERFFLSYGRIWRMNYTEPYLRMLVNVDPHSPNPNRVNGPLSNFNPFFDAFNVAEGDAMRRPSSDIVEIW